MARQWLPRVEDDGQSNSGTNAGRKTPKNDDINSVEEVLERLGFSMRLIKAHPDVEQIIKRLGRKLASGKVDERTLYSEFKDLLNASDFGKRPSSEITADLARYQENNADWRQNLSALIGEINRAAVSKIGRRLSRDEAREIAIGLLYENSGFLRGAYDPTKIDQSLDKYITVSDVEDDPATEQIESGVTQLGGTVGDAQRELLKWFAANGVQVTGNEFTKHLRDLNSGAKTLDQVKQDYRDKVFSARYAAYADRFREGLDVADVALSFRQTVANLLEKTDVGLDNHLVRKALEYVDPETKQPRAIAGYEFERMVREDPEWQKTDNAFSQYAKVGRDLLKTFGFEV